MKTEGKVKTPYKEKINTHLPSGWCVQNTFIYGDVSNSLRMYRGKDCVGRFIEHIKDEVKRQYVTFPQQPMTQITNVLKREHEAVAKFHICLKDFNNPENREVEDHYHYMDLYQGAVHRNCKLKYRIPDYIPISFHNLSGYDAHFLSRSQEKSLKRMVFE